MRSAVLAVLVTLVCGNALAQQANVNLDYNPQKNTENLVPFSAPLNSPDVRDDRTVTFRLKAPEARSVTLVGPAILLALGAERPVPFQKGDDGVWSLTVGPLRPDLYVYHFDVDGMRIADPSNTIAGFTAMPPFSQLVVHGDGPAYYDARDVPHGTVTRHVYKSDVTGGQRELYVYTPPDYDRSKKYPVLYLVGGSGELARDWSEDGRERRDDRRDRRDDRRDLKHERKEQDRTATIRLEYQGLVGKTDGASLGRKHALLSQLIAMERREVKKDVQEKREDRRELREDRRDLREERRQRR